MYNNIVNGKSDQTLPHDYLTVIPPGFICQVPGCGMTTTKPWNHLYPGKRHSKLTDKEKNKFLALIRAAGTRISTQPS